MKVTGSKKTTIITTQCTACGKQYIIVVSDGVYGFFIDNKECTCGHVFNASKVHSFVDKLKCERFLEYLKDDPFGDFCTGPGIGVEIERVLEKFNMNFFSRPITYKLIELILKSFLESPSSFGLRTKECFDLLSKEPWAGQTCETCRSKGVRNGYKNQAPKTIGFLEEHYCKRTKATVSLCTPACGKYRK